MINLSELAKDLVPKPCIHAEGHLISSKGSVLIAKIPGISIGDSCHITKKDGSGLLCSVIGFEEDLCMLAASDSLFGVSSNAKITSSFKPINISITDSMIGNVLNPLGKLYSDSSEISAKSARELPIQNAAPSALKRSAVNQQMLTGINTIDLFNPIAYGQRLGIFAGAGMGKSTLLSMLCNNAAYDLVIVGMIGERGREVSEFIEQQNNSDRMKKCILVVSTSDESSFRRFLAAQTATTIAEYFRNKGKKVLLLIDSLTRAARALRDLSLAAGEIPIRQGYTTSVYAELPKLIERAGNTDKGSITAIYVLLTQNDESNDALGEEVKSLLDGHIVLSEEIANQGIRPAIDITKSISRVAFNLWSHEQIILITKAKHIISRINRDKDILLLGGEADLELKAALAVEPDLIDLLNQRPDEKKEYADSLSRLQKIVTKFEMLKTDTEEPRSQFK